MNLLLPSNGDRDLMLFILSFKRIPSLSFLLFSSSNYEFLLEIKL